MTPLLRSPPFPGVGARIAAVDEGPAISPADPAAGREAARAMVAARVGGCFWGAAVVGRRRLVVLADGDPEPVGDLADTVIVARKGRCRGAAKAGALIVDNRVDPWPLIDAATEVVCAPGGEIDVLALAAGKPVFTPDGQPLDDQDGALFARVLLGRRYRNPYTGEPIDVAAAIELLGHWRLLIGTNRDLAAAAGIAFWKRREVARLLWDGRQKPLAFLAPAVAVMRAKGGAVAAWPARVPADFAKRAAAAKVPVRWVEDGFLRSAGLGSDLLPPLSLIVDDLWPYFDPARPSRLETILQETRFDAGLRARAAALRATIVDRRIGKYHVGGAVEAITVPAGARLVVVVGQVEDDLSVLLGGGGLTNFDVIKRARAEEPDAFIIYRPHPDVEAGHRRGAIPDTVALELADRIHRGGSLDALLARADALHTLTSLTGFEALMRGVRVVVHGTPFYAGWGLTDDRGLTLKRRTRRLSLDELIAGALILYPRYLDARTGLPCTPEQFINGLEGVVYHAGWMVRLRRWQGKLKRTFG